MHERSYLFVPGNRPERFDKACASGADAVILDLEDAVGPADKPAARDAVCAWLARRQPGGVPVHVRINAADTPYHADDVRCLTALNGLAGPAGLVVPKAASGVQLRALAAQLPAHAVLLPLIETAAGFDALRELARAPRVARLLFGTLDFQVETGIRGTGDALLMFRSMLTYESVLAGLDAPVDGIAESLDDARLIHDDTTRARNLGFGAKLCIHPKQIAPVHAAFAHSADEIAWARRVIDALERSGGAATTVDGKMIDAPVARQAERILRACAATTPAPACAT
ncbi:HpcH/HpaI aldolase/citrate lyase family protein [Burkholderia sp. Ac-20379]|uniref:HpcH/HpaI aldolase/citrate lyase family protein n=1 Tax=Burkholderia sp. Ac-20379 TaxID=2703900 RepID=UPI0019818C34|nr:CoA ester lyase [Burkholderia sp. Ac-20379]MBN3725218.1 CoA ester lyase [Burkholderia sp. Ac-20379]